MTGEEQSGGSGGTGGSRVAFTASSAGRRLRPRRPLGPRIVLGILLLLAGMVAVFQLRPEPAPPPPPPPSPTPTARPAATATATPTPEAVEMSGDWIEVVPEPTVTPTPWPTATPRVRRLPTPTPRVAQCIDARWHAVQSYAPLNRVRVTIEATNHCGRELGPSDVWFRVSGWRQGAMVQTVEGHLMDELWPGYSEEVVIGLPGSLDWYDEVRVEVHGPGEGSH